jgi:hypothetical protein
MSHLLFEESQSKPMLANELLDGLTNAARDNPLSAALLGAGLLWVLGRDIAAHLNADNRVRARAQSLGSKINESASREDAAAGSFNHGMSKALNGFTEFWEEQPLIVGAVGLAIGAGLASLFPATSVETKILGPNAEHLATQAKRLVTKKAL